MSLKIFTVVRRFCGSLNVIALVLGGLFVIQGRMTIGDLVAFNGFLWMLNMPMRMSGWLINDVQRFTASSIKIRQLLATKPKIPIAREKAEPIQGYVTFDHVSFHFQMIQKPHFIGCFIFSKTW